MKIDLTKLEDRLRFAIKDFSKEAQRVKIPVFIIGGVVRDIILKRNNLDLDIVTEGPVLSLARAVAKKHKARVTAYGEFGTATVEYPDGFNVDLAMTRKEHYPHPGALPKVQPGDIHEDLFLKDLPDNI